MAMPSWSGGPIAEAARAAAAGANQPQSRLARSEQVAVRARQLTP